MKIASRLAASALAAFAAMAAGSAVASDLTVTLNTRTEGGRIAVAIYRDADSLRRGKGAVRTVMVPYAGATTTTTITGLEPGRYVIATFHDVDGNGQLTLWPIGLPKEHYGFSNNARGRFGPPAFDDAAFTLSASGTRQTITLK